MIRLLLFCGVPCVPRVQASNHGALTRNTEPRVRCSMCSNLRHSGKAWNTRNTGIFCGVPAETLVTTGADTRNTRNTEKNNGNALARKT